MLNGRSALAMASMLVMLVGLPHALAVEDRRVPVKIEGKSVLPLKVLARPFSNIYKEPDVSKGTVEENVPTFQPYFVYTRPEVSVTTTEVIGWYEVGSDNRGTVLGWMRAEDVLEWKQTLSLAYTHPQGRHPVLMFEKLDVLQDLVKSGSDVRTQRAEDLYAALLEGQISPEFPVVSVEPQKAVDISKQFYLLPVLEFGPVEVDRRPARILKLAAATAAGPDAREKSTIKDNPEYLKEATQAATEVQSEKLKTLGLDLVFVMDLTSSMQPYIDATLEVIKKMAQYITKDADMRTSVSFGLWGYRDSPDVPGLEFLTKNFTPELQPIDQFEKTLSSVKAARVGSDDYPEDVFSGVDKAMRDTRWRDNALRFIVLMGDAPSHELGHRWNYSGQTEKTLRSYADDQKIYLLAFHIKDPRAVQFHELAETQFRHLARNKGVDSGSSYYSSDARDLEGFTRATNAIAEEFVGIVAAAKQGQVAATASKPPANPSSPSPDARAIAANMGHAALVEWIGKETEAKAPRDVTAWAVDKDLIDPSIQALDVRLLINKRQLDSLKTVLGQVINAGRRGQIGGESFFTALQATVAMAARNPEQIKNAASMKDLIPEFLDGLPYQSKLMAMSNDLWASWSTDEQDEFIRELDAKIQYYAAIHDTPGGWIQLNKGDDPDEAVYPIDINMLP